MTLPFKSLVIMLAFFLYICLPLTCMEGNIFPDTASERRIGVELETSAIKGAPLGTIASFNIKTSASLWDVGLDTRDFSDTIALYNMELKTINGYDKTNFLSTLALMIGTLKYFYATVQEKNNFYTLKRSRINRILNQVGLNNFDIIGGRADSFKITKNAANDHTVVEPQITYQISLSEVPRIFNRIADLGELNAKDFCKVFSDDFSPYPELTYPEIEEYRSKELRKNSQIEDKIARELKNKVTEKFVGRFKVMKIYNLFNRIFYPQIKCSSDKVKGFSYLFLYYWASIFNNSYASSLEPGPKSYLTIMSRLPFSDIYKNGLNPQEKKEFNRIFAEIVSKCGKHFKLRTYIYYDSEKGINKEYISQFTLYDWYQSIVEDNLGRSDLLSPPPNLPNDYAMGQYRWESTKSLLLEVRGYSIIKYDKKDIDIYNVEDFLTKEAIWFFDN